MSLRIHIYNKKCTMVFYHRSKLTNLNKLANMSEGNDSILFIHFVLQILNHYYVRGPTERFQRTIKKLSNRNVHKGDLAFFLNMN